VYEEDVDAEFEHVRRNNRFYKLVIVSRNCWKLKICKAHHLSVKCVSTTICDNSIEFFNAGQKQTPEKAVQVLQYFRGHRVLRDAQGRENGTAPVLDNSIPRNYR
jgi:hypothetical protein